MGVLFDIVKAGIKVIDDRAMLKKENPISELNKQIDLDIQQPQFDITAHLAVYTINVYCYAAMKSIARDVSSTDFLLQKEVLIDGNYIWETITRTLENKPFIKANQYETFSKLIERTVLSLLATGNGYIIYDKLDREFFYVKPDFVNVKVDANGNPVGYIISNAGIIYNADIHDVIHFKLANPSGEYFGVPPSLVIREEILTKLALGGYIKSFFKNSGLPGMTFTTDQSLSKEQREKTRQEIQRMFSAGNAFKSAILEAGQKMDRMSHNMKDLVPKEINDIIREDVGAAYGTPPAKLGLFGNMTFANADIMDKTYMRDTVQPIAKSVASDITHQLLSLTFDDMRLWWDSDSVKVLQEDNDKLVERQIKLKGAGIISTNEARLALNMKPDDDESSDELKATSSTPPQLMVPDPVPEEDEEKWLRKYTSKRFNYDTKDLHDDRDRIKRRNELQLVTVEKGFEKILKRFWNDQLKRILDNIDSITVDGKVNTVLMYGIINKGATEDARLLLDLIKENEFLEEAITSYIDKVGLVSGQQGMREVGVVGIFDMSDPRVQRELNKAINRIKSINKTSFKRMIGVMKEDYANGETITTVSKNIRNLFKEFSRSRAMTIARTEMNAVVSSAKLVGGIQAGATHKEWFSTLDGETRDAHVISDGQIVPIKKSFEVDGEGLQYPGDPNGSAGNVINCRCSSVNITLEE